MTARDRWRALPREVLHDAIQVHLREARHCNEEANMAAEGGEDSATHWWRARQEAHNLAASLLRQAARKERK